MPDSSSISPSLDQAPPMGGFMDDILDNIQNKTALGLEADDAPPIPPPAEEELPEGHLLHGYRLKRKIGGGGFGLTYLAKDELLNRSVVIKENFPRTLCERDAATHDVRLRDSASDADWQWAYNNFLREVRLLASINHPYIAKVYSFFKAHGTAYYVTRHIDGKSLADVAQNYADHRMPIPQHALYALMVRILDALDYLHRRQIHHRDIKPDNILITRLGRPVLIDFGAAREKYGDVTANVVQTTGFSPPEQHSSNGRMGDWTDLYAFGATLYYILTNSPPPASRIRQLYDTAETLSRQERLCALYHPRLLHSIDKALAPSIENRYHSVAEWMNDLRECPS